MIDAAYDIEKWADIPGWEGLYQISDLGRLKSFKVDPSGTIMSTVNKKGGYLSTVLCAKGRTRQSEKIHRLVAKAFIPNPDGKPEVNHKDCNRQNNRASNLEWATRTENYAHAKENGLLSTAMMNEYNRTIRPKAILQLTLSGKLIARFTTAKEARKQTGVCARNILMVASKKEYSPGKTRSQAGGFLWRFEDDCRGVYVKF